MRDANTDAQAAPRRIAFERVVRLVEVAMGPGWWHDPTRWPTADGFAPYAVVWSQWDTIKASLAWHRMNLIDAVNRHHLPPAIQRIESQKDYREAFGG